MLLGLFDGTASWSMLPEHFGENRIEKEKKEREEKEREEKAREEKEREEKERKRKESNNPPLTLGDILKGLLSLVVIIGIIQVFILIKREGYAFLQEHFVTTIRLLTKWYVIALIVGMTVFIVSLKSSSGIGTAVVEAVLAAGLYHVMSLIPQPGPISEFYEMLLSGWTILIFPLLLYVPLIMDTVFLAVGSSKNPILRSNYIIMNRVFLFISAGFFWIWTILESSSEESGWNFFWSTFFYTAIFVIFTVICFLIERKILGGQSGRTGESRTL